MTSRPSTAAPILAVLAIVLVTLGRTWAGTCGWESERFGTSAPLDGPYVIIIERTYTSRLEANIFLPLAGAEEVFNGKRVVTRCPDDPHELSFGDEHGNAVSLPPQGFLETVHAPWDDGFHDFRPVEN